jgi:hypothetical protein
VDNTRKSILAALLALTTMAGWSAEPAPAPAPTQSFRIGSIDFHGVRTLDTAVLRKALAIHEGDTITMAQSKAFQQRLETQPPPVPGVTQLRAAFVCCGDGGTMAVFIGVQETGQTVLQWHAKPTGRLQLPADLLQADAAVEHAIVSAVQSGQAQEDDSQGHMLLLEPKARALQEQLPNFARRDLPLLRRVLHESADDEQRALAARMLGYAPDKQAVVEDLVYAMTDSSAGVRNDAMRALSVFARATHPPRVPYEPFVALLDSPTWTDLNKATFALAPLTESRDPALLALLKARALRPLAEVARWQSREHAFAGYLILGRIAGVPEKELLERWQRNDTEAVIRKAVGH